jgi:hypothetical protein
VITDHFKPATRKDNAILSFRKMRQTQGETIESFVDRLRIEAKNKSLSDAEDNIRLQLITGAISNKIRLKAESEDMSLKDLTIYARTIETLHEYHHVQNNNNLNLIKQEQANQVYQHNYQNKNQHKQTNHHQYNQGKQFMNKNQSNTCGMCGFEYPHKNNCPAQGKQCNNCGRLNHFTKVCRSKPSNSSNSYKTNKPKLNHKTNYVTSNDFESSNEDEHNINNDDDETLNQQTYMLQNQNINNQSIINSENEIYNVYGIMSQEMSNQNTANEENKEYNTYAIANKTNTKCPRIDVWIGNNKVNMGPDTQSSINAINIETFNQLEPKPKLMSNDSILYSYDSKKPMKSVGKFDAEITVNNRKTLTTIIY